MSRVQFVTIRPAVSTLQVVALVACILAVPLGSAHEGPPRPQPISIAEARSLPLGTVVTVAGFITVPSGAFSSSTFDQGFAIQDPTGGIYVSVPDNLGFAPRQRVRVTGTLADSFGLLTLNNVTDSKAQGKGPNVRPLPVATGDVGEATEGKLVRITGTIAAPILNDLPFGFIVVVNDGSVQVKVFVNASTGIDVSSLSQGQTIEVTGFSGEFADTFEVDPRFQSDITVVP
jgi:hypothetical protein